MIPRPELDLKEAVNISEEGWWWIHDRNDNTDDQKVRNKAQWNTNKPA